MQLENFVSDCKFNIWRRDSKLNLAQLLMEIPTGVLRYYGLESEDGFPKLKGQRDVWR
ncbi:holin [Salmonella phage 18-India]|nr:holin [Salmonella phage 18-India]